MNNDKTAREMLEEALKVKAEAVEVLKKVNRNSEENAKLLSRCEETILKGLAPVSPAVHVKFAEDVSNRNCHDVILGIVELGLVNRDVIQIHATWDPNCCSFYLSVFPLEQVWSTGAEIVRLLKADVYIDRNRYEDDATPLQQLLELEDKLLELIADAKDKAEVKA
ncbi:hypothetical protein [Photobacterium ganghwense]|uniref:hypothetical protein n=1 Tax=Photobacterium ganghwense TaxID=320778 RepID=UPI0039EE9E7D